MYKWAIRRQIRRNVAALAAGDPGPVLAGYADDAVLFARVRWGRIVHQEDFEDTQKVEAFDRFLDARTARTAGTQAGATPQSG